MNRFTTSKWLAYLVLSCMVEACHQADVRTPEPVSIVDLDSACAPCGCWRWQPKTGADPTVSAVSPATVDTTITQLANPVAMPAPANLGADWTTRYRPPISTAEVTTWQLRNVRLIKFAVEEDSDIHLAIQDPNPPYRTMIAEIPDGRTPQPSCVSATSPWLEAIQSVRATFTARCHPTKVYQKPDNGCVAGSDVITLRGIGFFDMIHPADDQAANGLELHPVLQLCFGADCTF